LNVWRFALWSADTARGGIKGFGRKAIGTLGRGGRQGHVMWLVKMGLGKNDAGKMKKPP
jgi:hypothetical protein